MHPSTGRLRLVICSTGIPHVHFHAKLSASLMTLYSYIEELKKAGIPLLHILVLDKKNMDVDLLARYRSEMEEPGVLDIAVWETPALVRPRSHFYQPFQPVTLPDSVHEQIRAFHPDAIFCLDAYSVGALNQVNDAPILVQVHDPKFQTLWYHSVYAIREGSGHLKDSLLDIYKAWLWRGYYHRVLRHATRIVTVAVSGANALKKLGLQAKHFPMLWAGVREVPTLRPPLPEKPTFLFQGNLAGLGSRSALHFLLDRTYPLIKKQWGEGGFSILLCGTRTLPSWVEESIRTMPEVEFLGFVDDIAGLMMSCHAVLAPIDVPVGNRTRILTAMSLEVLTIAHTTIATGNPHLVDGQTCYLADEPAAFVERMVRAYDRPPEVADIIKRAKHVYDTEFRPDAATASLIRELEDMVADKQAQRSAS